VEGNDLVTEEVVTGWDVAWDLDIPLTSSLSVESVDGPDTTVETLLLDLEPAEGLGVGGGGSIRDLGEVGDDWALVGVGDWVITASLGTGDVVPLDLDGGTGVN
jgi:hypothetical protein